MKREDIRAMVEESFNKVFSGNTRLNEGKIENHSSDELKKYYSGLRNNEGWAKEKQKEKFDSISKIDVEKMLKDIDE